MTATRRREGRDECWWSIHCYEDNNSDVLKADQSKQKCLLIEHVGIRIMLENLHDSIILFTIHWMYGVVESAIADRLRMVMVL